MKVIASLKRAFWKKYHKIALFRKLRPRLMTMILTLVLPISLTCGGAFRGIRRSGAGIELYEQPKRLFLLSG